MWSLKLWKNIIGVLALSVKSEEVQVFKTNKIVDVSDKLIFYDNSTKEFVKEIEL